MNFDAVVVGAGVMGSATARALARAGTSVCLIERFHLGHTRGSSHGRSRIFRYSYPDPTYVEMAMESFDLWRELEAEAGADLLTITGGYDIGPEIEANALALERCGARFELLDGGDVGEREPSIETEHGMPVLFQPDGGIVAADRAGAAFLESARAAGAEVREETSAAALEPRADAVDVVLETGGRITAPVVVVAAGAWARPLLATAGIDLDVRPTRETVAFFDSPHEIVPTLVEWGNPSIYSLPSPGQGIKAGEHIAGPETDPNVGGAVNHASVERLGEWVARRFPGATRRAHHAETCLYTNTPDEHFVLERYGSIVVGSPCSGHGFKFAPWVGRRLAQLATG